MSQSEGQTFLGSVADHVISTLKGVALLFVILGGYFVVWGIAPRTYKREDAHLPVASR